VHSPSGCALAARSLVFLLLPCTFHLLGIFPQKFIQTAKNVFKTPIQQTPNTHLWLVPSHSGMLPYLSCWNEVLRGFLFPLYFFDDCGLCCCYLLYSLHDKVCKFVLYFHRYLIESTLHRSKISNYMHCLFLQWSHSLL
jgi:hypothetical protein